MSPQDKDTRSENNGAEGAAPNDETRSSTMVVCRLCGIEGEIVQSHIIPAFASRWLKETSATGFLRGFHVPNKRVQDFPTMRLLCRNCEQRFSTAEKKFAELVFVPFHEQRYRFPYEDWLLYFAASLAWRCLATSKREGLLDHPQHIGGVGQLVEKYLASGIDE